MSRHASDFFIQLLVAFSAFLVMLVILGNILPPIPNYNVPDQSFTFLEEGSYYQKTSTFTVPEHWDDKHIDIIIPSLFYIEEQKDVIMESDLNRIKNKSYYEDLSIFLIQQPVNVPINYTISFKDDYTIATINSNLVMNNKTHQTLFTYTLPQDLYIKQPETYTIHPVATFLPQLRKSPIIAILIVLMSIAFVIGMYYPIKQLVDGRRIRRRDDDFFQSLAARYIAAQESLREDLLERMQEQIKTKPSIITIPDDGEIREFKTGNGLFQRGIKKFKVPPYEEQVKEILALPEVIEYKTYSKEATINLKKYGQYYVRIRSNPISLRVSKEGKLTTANPYISPQTGLLCLGNARPSYTKNYVNENYYECLRLIIQVLKSKDGKGFQDWKDCKYDN